MAPVRGAAPVQQRHQRRARRTRCGRGPLRTHQRGELALAGRRPSAPKKRRTSRSSAGGDPPVAVPAMSRRMLGAGAPSESASGNACVGSLVPNTPRDSCPIDRPHRRSAAVVERRVADAAHVGGAAVDQSAERGQRDVEPHRALGQRDEHPSSPPPGRLLGARQPDPASSSPISGGQGAVSDVVDAPGEGADGRHRPAVWAGEAAGCRGRSSSPETR
jgi:hypothetical protein